MKTSKNQYLYSGIYTAILAATFGASLLLSACGGSSSSGNKNQNTNGSQQQSDGLFAVRGDWAIMNGEITSKIVEQLNTLVKNNPQVKTIVMANVPGSSDDEMNLKAGLVIPQFCAHGIFVLQALYIGQVVCHHRSGFGHLQGRDLIYREDMNGFVVRAGHPGVLAEHAIDGSF